MKACALKWQSTGLDTGSRMVRAGRWLSGDQPTSPSCRVSFHAAIAVLILALFAAPALAQFPDYQQQAAAVLSTFDPPLRIACPAECVQADDDMKGLYTRRVAYVLHQLNPNIGLQEKTGGSNSRGYSTDVLIDKSTGGWVDVATTRSTGDGFRVVGLNWEVHEGSLAPQWVSLWKEPTLDLAGLSDTGKGGGGGKSGGTSNGSDGGEGGPDGGQVISDAMQRAIFDLLKDHDAREEAHWANVKKFWDTAVGNVIEFIVKWIVPPTAGVWTGMQIAKP